MIALLDGELEDTAVVLMILDQANVLGCGGDRRGWEVRSGKRRINAVPSPGVDLMAREPRRDSAAIVRNPQNCLGIVGIKVNPQMLGPGIVGDTVKRLLDEKDEVPALLEIKTGSDTAATLPSLLLEHPGCNFP